MRISDWSSDVSSSDLKGKAQRRDGAEAKREEQNPPRIHPVGQAGQDRHGRDVAAVIDAADPASLGVRPPPFGQKRRQQRRKAGRGQERENIHETEVLAQNGWRTIPYMQAFEYSSAYS